jgi:thymidylate synthase (FAD)
MKVQLVNYSQKPQYIYEDVPATVLDMIAYCARVSNPANQNNKETSEKLVKYLINNAHWSPLEMVSMCLEIETTRDIARQILRHRSFSFQEFSQRYANPNDLDDMFTTREARFQDTKNRQNSVSIEDLPGEAQSPAYLIANQWEVYQDKVIAQSREAYDWAIENGIAKEQARAVLPEGLTMSKMYMNGTIRSWVHFIELRSGHGTQLEHMEIAKLCGEVLSVIFPLESIT